MSLRAKAWRCLLLTGALGLLLMCTGCDQILADILAGDECGDHAVCERAAAKAGAAAGAVALTGAALQARRDEEDGDEPGETDDGDGDEGGGDGGGDDSAPEWSLSKRPTDDHVWDAKENKWVLRTEEDKAQAMRDKGYEFDEDYGDGGAWREKVDKVEAVEIPKEKGDVTLPEYKSGLISPTAEARYDRLEARYEQLNELEGKALEEYKRTRNELREAQDSGDGWLAERLQKNLETAKQNVDAIQAEKMTLSSRHEYHSDQQFQERYNEGWTTKDVARELLVDPFVHMIAPDMSDAVDVMANAIAARNKLQTQIDRQDSKLFGEHDRAMKELRDIIQQRRDALDKGDTEAAARLKEKAEGVKDRLKDVTKRMQSIQEDNVDYQKKALKATLETGTTAADRVISGRGAYETTKYVAGKAGFQTQKPQIQSKRPTIEEVTDTAKGDARQVKGAKEPATGGKGGSGGGKSPEAKQIGSAKEPAGAGKSGSGASKAQGAKQTQGVKEPTGAGKAGSGGGKPPGGGEGGSGSGGGKPPHKSLKQMVRENPNPAQQAGRRAEAKAGWEQQYQEHAAKARAEGRVVRDDIRGRSLPSTEKGWISRDVQLGISEAKGSLVNQWELVGVDPSPRVLEMRAANPKFAEIDVKIRECWKKAGPGVGPGFEPDYYGRFEANLHKAHVSDADFQGWRKAIETGRYEAPGGYTPPSKPPTMGSPSLPPRPDPVSPKTYVPPPKE